MPKTGIADRAANYKAVMASEPGTVAPALYADAVAFAKEKKRKRPTEAAEEVLPGIPGVVGPCLIAKTAVEEARADAAVKRASKKADKPAAEPKGDRVANAGKECLEEGCDKPAYAKGRCTKHYTAHRRQDPDVMEAARKASREYRARQA